MAIKPTKPSIAPAETEVEVIADQAAKIEELTKRLFVVESEYEAACTELREKNEAAYADRMEADRKVPNQEPKTAKPKVVKVNGATPDGKPFKIGVETN